MKSATPRRRPPAPRRPYVQVARAQAAEETARRIVAAFLDRLLTHWYDEITLDRVAADAGVTVQTVIRRFGGKEGLLDQATKVLGAQIVARRAGPPGDIDRLAANVVADYEQTGDAVLRLLALEPRHPALSTYLNFGRRGHREWLESTLQTALAGLDAPARSRAVDALVIATDVYAWKLLRRDMGRSIAAATATIARQVKATLSEFTQPNTTSTRTTPGATR